MWVEDRISGIGGFSDLSVVKLSSSEYNQLVAGDSILSNCIYIVEDDGIDAMGEKIRNLAPGTEISDAATFGQLSSVAAAASGKQDISNLVSSVTSASTHVQYPSAKCVYDLVGTVESALDLINGSETWPVLSAFATKASPAVSGNFAALDQNGNLADSGKKPSDYYLKSETSSASQIAAALTGGGGGGSSLYPLETAQLQAAGSSLSCAVSDHAITRIQISSAETPIIVNLPQPQAGGARDLILRIEISSSSAPAFTFSGVGETIHFDSESEDWYVLEPGLNLVSFTETKGGT